ncbi:MAG: hypothetical protein AMQ22_00023 [Candidatus Methanofastidiosum methylothiophilum]|uniref:Uncharacterized protein n=1 Tax=Candidatus Methanofastidiosum methylothiophilum TaxID=1705564 RepID=A0A150JA56_9EURY|nr:MAG: hypothetical protein AMQ22_00023 [Candidatus Methanofastidiosum methylthiophilus]
MDYFERDCIIVKEILREQDEREDILAEDRRLD